METENTKKGEKLQITKYWQTQRSKPPTNNLCKPETAQKQRSASPVEV